MSRLVELRTRIRGEEKGLLTKYSARVGRIERWRPWFALLGVVGALLAALARTVAGSTGIGLTVAGGVLAAVGAALVVLMDYKKLEIAPEAQTAHDIAEEAVAEAEALEQRLVEQKRLVEQAAQARDSDLERVQQQAQTKVDAVERNWKVLDRQRRARLRALRRLIEIVEAAQLNQADARTTAEKMLNIANDRIRQAVGVEGDDDFTISIFQRDAGRGAKSRMRRIGCYCTHAQERNYDKVSWLKGRGYTGTLWHEATANTQAALVIPDTRLPELRDKYPVDRPDPERDARYVSVACFPILIGRTQNVWGVVTATINRENVFARIGGKPTQGVEMVEDVAYVAALLAGLGAGG